MVPATITGTDPSAHGQRGLNLHRNSSFEFDFNSINFLLELDRPAKRQRNTTLAAHQSEQAAKGILISAFE